MADLSPQSVVIGSKNADLFRRNMKTLFCQLLDERATLGANVEIGAYNYALKEASSRRVVKKWDNTFMTLIYIDRIRSLYMNLCKPDSALRRSLLKGGVSAPTLAEMTHQELDTDRWRELIDRQLSKDAHTFDAAMEASTDLFTCHKCKNNKCKYYQLQTRSADENITTYVTCCHCGNSWRC